jgi:3-hydroxybutyryl-CoA dehydrogenase
MSFNLPTDFPSRPVAIIGAGTLGRRIALMFAAHGAEVRIYDLAERQRSDAIEYVSQNLPGLADRFSDVVPGRVSADGDLGDAVRNAWLVIEAVPERLELKRQVFGQLDEQSAADAILASNSSSYASRMFLDKVGHPERVLNIHFYMPPNQNAVDVMSCGKTDRDVIDFVLATLPRFGLYPFEARRESTGFIFNRVWAAVKRECLEVVAEGVSTPQEIDRMFEINTGSTAGPFRMMDQVGLDVVLDIEEHYCAEHPEYPEGPRRLLRTYVKRGQLGAKSGAGFYDDYPQPAQPTTGKRSGGGGDGGRSTVDQ